MSTISNVELKLVHDIARKKVKVTVNADVSLTALERDTLPASGAAGYRINCRIRGEDPHNPNDDLYDFPNTFELTRNNAADRATHHFTFEREIDSSILNEDKTAGNRDEVYAVIYLHNLLLEEWYQDTGETPPVKKAGSKIIRGWFGEEG
jgi:hypothetical protein